MSKLHHEHDAVRVSRSLLDEVAGCRVLLLGEDNPQSSEPEHALYPYPEGCAGNRLQSDILQVETSTYLGLWRTNLCCPSWSTKAARARAAALLELRDPPWDTIVMLGAKVAGIVGRPNMEPFESCRRVAAPEPGVAVRFDLFGEAFAPIPGELQLVYLPHPSGRCRAWNDPGAAARARMVMRSCVPEINWGELAS